jgi:hypothetical protein
VCLSHLLISVSFYSLRSESYDLVSAPSNDFLCLNAFLSVLFYLEFITCKFMLEPLVFLAEPLVMLLLHMNACSNMYLTD